MIYCSGEPRSPIEPIVKSVRHNTNYWFISVSLNIVKVVYMFVLFFANKTIGEHGSPLQTTHNFHHIKAYVFKQINCT